MQLRKGLALTLAFALFFLSIQAIRAGAHVPDALVARLDDGTNALGLAWIGAYLALAGSPIAALAVTLHGGGAIDARTLYAMLSGSRLGAEAIVLVTGAMAMLRGRRAAVRAAADKRGIEVGFLAFLVAFTVYFPATVIGLLLVDGWTPRVSFAGTAPVATLTDFTTRPLIGALVAAIGPGWTTLLGVVGLWVAFRLFEKSLPTPRTAGPLARAAKRMLLRPSLTFLLGALVTAIVTTVSISMTLLVPLHMRGLVTRGQIAAYMLGAGVTTLVDTWFTAVVNQDPVAQGAVLLLGGLVLAFSALCILLFRPAVKLWSRALDTITASSWRMVAAGSALVVVPVLLAFL